jgi:hypothetical protein
MPVEEQSCIMQILEKKLTQIVQYLSTPCASLEVAEKVHMEPHKSFFSLNFLRYVVQHFTMY